MKISKKQLKKIIAEERGALGYGDLSGDSSWADLQVSIDDVTESLDLLADKYVTSAWLHQYDNVIAEKIAERLEKLYHDAEALGGLIRGAGVGKE